MAHGQLKPRAKHLHNLLMSKSGSGGMHGPKTNKQRRAREKRTMDRFVQSEIRGL